MDKRTIENIRDDILNGALESFTAWSWDFIVQAALSKGYTAGQAHAVFPGGIHDVLDRFSGLCDREMLKKLASLEPEDMRVRDRISKALLARYEFLTPHREAFKGSLAFWSMPLRKSRGLKIIWRTADCIWIWAGDTAMDYNHYTKRGLLGGVIVSASLAWLAQGEDDHDFLKAFIDRRIENVMQLNKISGIIKRRA